MAEQITDTTAKTAFPAVTKVNVLVVDDRPDGLLAMEAVLSGSGYKLFKANSGHEALRYAFFNDFAVILLDVQMPEMDGFETAELLRRNYRSNDTPIIFVTAISKEIRHINQGYETGAVDYIFKPFDPFVLKSKINVFVELFNKNLQLKEQTALLRQIEAQEKERQITELKQESKRSYMSLADAVPHSIIKISTSGTIEYFNQQWINYTGYHSQVNWDSLIHPKDRRKLLALWLRMHQQPLNTFEKELRLHQRGDGTYRWQLVNIVPEVRNGENIGWIVSATDIDNIKRTEESFKTLSQELNRSNKELEEYAYVASHDLKEPLHVISSFVYLLEKRFQAKLEEGEKQYITYIKEGVAQAQRLIKELLEYSCIGRSKSFEAVDLALVLNEVTANLRTIIEKEGATLKIGPLPKITANYLEMVQLFQNLVVNAIKYRSDRSLKIDLNAMYESGMWFFTVRDNGIGIEPQYKERIFDMFQRLHAKSKYSGTGIGLAICKKIVEHHGGKIWIESSIGEGTTFHFSIKRGL